MRTDQTSRGFLSILPDKLNHVMKSPSYPHAAEYTITFISDELSNLCPETFHTKSLLIKPMIYNVGGVVRASSAHSYATMWQLEMQSLLLCE